jgi:chitin disaccharide deacetylase
MNSSKKLIINADDFGRSLEINAAVERAAQTGLLGGVSVLANGECWDQAVSFLRNTPKLSAGVHLNVVELRPVSTAPEVTILTGANGMFLGLARLLTRWALRPFAVSRAVEIEWRAQIERLTRAGVRVTHVDSHQHVHAFPPAYRCAVGLCKEYGIGAIRHPCENNNRRGRLIPSLALQGSLVIARGLTRSPGLRHNDHFLGFKRAGAYRFAELIDDLRAISNGLTEVALHPSLKDGVPYPKMSGGRELAALMDDSLADRIRQLGIELTTWAAVSQ